MLRGPVRRWRGGHAGKRGRVRRQWSAQPRRRGPGRLGNDIAAPDPGFTAAQYRLLALLYTIASVRAGLLAHFDWHALGVNLLLLQALQTYPAPNDFNAPSWSISAEFYTYLLFAALVLALGGRRLVAICGVVVAASAALLLWLAPRPFALECSSYLGIFRCTLGFFLGAGVVFGKEPVVGGSLPSCAAGASAITSALTGATFISPRRARTGSAWFGDR